MIGTRLGPYEITAKLGEGGMGEVFRATDTKLKREVAIKVLPAAFVADPERLARFEREAQLLAQLQHPNIASIYGLEESDGTRALVLELVEGPTLADRLAQGSLSLEESLAVARQIAEALEEAHEKGIVHRDLKPQNVKAAIEGKVKVLDFGLAKAMDPTGAASGAGSASQLAVSPTLTLGATVQGVILGTAGYMAPEQAKGFQADKRADIWAFGVVLFEMLAGRRAFGGETVSETLASVLKDPIDWSALPADTPRHVVRLLRRCLERDPKRRLRDIGEARVALEGPVEEPAATPVSASAPRARVGVATLAAFAAVALAAAAIGWLARSPTPEPKTARFVTLPLPEGTRLATSGIQPGPPVVSPDGSRIAFVAEEANGERHLWVRDLAEREARKLAETEGASYPFWSFDGEHLGFFADQELKRVPARGGSVLALADAQTGKGGAWSRQGVLLFAPAFNSSIHQVSEAGGDARALTRVDIAGGEVSQRFPRFLDDGRRFLYVARGRDGGRNRILLGSLDGDAPREIARSSANGVLASGRLLFLRERTLVAQPFDEERGELTGAPAPLVEGIRVIAGAARMLADAAPGTLVFQAGPSDEGERLVWLDRAGATVAQLGEADLFGNPSLSPQDGKIAVQITDRGSGLNDIWIVDGASGNRERFTFEESNEVFPVYSPDGRAIAFSSNANGAYELLVKDVGGSGASRVLVANDDPDLQPVPRDWTPDGRELVYYSGSTASSGTTIFAIAVDGRSPPRRLVESSFRQPVARVSPDGRWLLFGNSSENGQPFLQVTELPAATRRWQLDRGAGGWWSRDGRELYIQDLERGFGVVEVRPRAEAFEWGPMRAILSTAGFENLSAGDGDRFLALLPAASDDPALRRLEVVLDWESLLEAP